jgi:methylmalonyl-CoA mutase N-terminal domain/subunit
MLAARARRYCRAMAGDDKHTDSGIEIRPQYTAADLSGWDPAERLGEPGRPPYTRGIYPTMHRGRLWTMRQYAGFGSAEATNARFKFLLGAGQTGLSCAFDLPTQMGYDSDHPRAEGEVGKVGVAIDSIEDMRLLFAGIPLDKVTTSMTINSTAAILLLLYELVAEEQGVPSTAIAGTIQNDLLKEYIARGTYVYPPRPSMRIITDIFAYCNERVPKWNTISISGYHIREAGSTAVQEIAFTLANGIAYVEAAMKAGLDVDEFAPRLSFFWNAHNHLFEEVAKYRAARRMWYSIMTERFGAKKESSKLLRFHTQTGGSTLTAQQPETNIVRVAVQALAAVLGGTQSLHTNSFDEALGLPTERSAMIALRTQQVIGYESGVVDTAPTTSSRSPTPSRRRPGSTSGRSTRWVAPSQRSSPATRWTRSSRRRTNTPSRSTTTTASSSGSTSSRSAPSPSRTCSRSTPRCRPGRSSGCAPCARRGTRRPSRRVSPMSRRRRAARRPCCTRCGPRWPPEPRSVRSATPSGPCTACTNRGDAAGRGPGHFLTVA